jgi:hypothetical protein
LNEDQRVIQANKDISQKEKVHSESNVFDTSANRANSMINDEFYHKERCKAGISPALLVTNAPLVDTDDKYRTK